MGEPGRPLEAEIPAEHFKSLERARLGLIANAQRPTAVDGHCGEYVLTMPITRDPISSRWHPGFDPEGHEHSARARLEVDIADTSGVL